MKIYYSLLLVILINFFGIAQDNTLQDFCGSQLVNDELMKKDPAFAERIKSFDKKLSQMTKSGKLSSFYNNLGKVYEIPIVVHVIHTGDAIGTQFNKSDADIQAWIDFTNKLYEGTTTPIGPGARAKIPIRFVLAKRDMNCKSTNGIIRIDGSKIPGYAQYGLKLGKSNGAEQNTITSLSRWNPRYYYNIYLVNDIGENSGVAGYAYYPGFFANDGAFMKSSIVNTKNNNNVLAHEMGHAMGLKHTFEGANPYTGVCPTTTGDCTVDDDGVCDTERAPSALYDWPCKTNSNINPCTGTTYQGVQYNIMNYGSCPDRFTIGQRDRAIAQILEFRQSQITSKGGTAPDSNNTPIVKTACTPSSIENAANKYDMGASSVVFGDINYKSGGYNREGNLFYIDLFSKCYANDGITEIKAGTATPLTISVRINDQNVKAYIDYNNDGVFDEATETVFSQQVSKNTPETVNVTPPSNAVTNKPLRMRIIADRVAKIISPCYNPSFGQVKDFAVTIIPSAIVCSAPTGLTFSNVNTNKATLNWNTIAGVQSYTIEYKTNTATTWTAVNTTANTYTISNLTASTQYNWRIKANCGTNNSSSYTNGTNFTTLAVCNAPTGLTFSNVNTNKATLNWNTIAGVQSYTIEYKTNTATTWTAVNTTANTYTISNLTASTQYNWRIKANCGTNNSSSYTNGTNFTTLAVCNAPTGLTFSNVNTNKATLNWNTIAGVQSYTIEYKTNTATTWTAVNTTANTYTISNLTASTQYNWRIKANCGTNNSSSYTNGTNFTTLAVCNAPTGLTFSNVNTNKATLNWNTIAGVQSYTIEYKTNTATTWTAVNTTANTYTISNLTASTQYNWRIKANCGTNNSSSYTNGTNFTTLAVCNAPTGLTFSNVNTNKATLNWNTIAGVQSYTIEYKTNTATTWTAVNTTANTYTISNLTASTQYNWRIKANCGTNNSSSYTNGTNFTTLAVCNAPTGLTFSNVNTNKATLNWNTIAGVQSYTIEYKTNTATTWTAVNTTANTYTISNLTASTQYNWRIKANCGTNNSSSYTNGTNFTTLTVYPQEAGITFYPNPVENILYINGMNFSDEDEIPFTIIDRYGRIILMQTTKFENIIKINVSHLPPNVYYLNISGRSFKFIKL